MRHSRIVPFALAGALLTAAGARAAPPPAPPISGVVRHVEAPVSGALVIFYNLSDTSLARSRTAADGTFLLASAPIGIYDLIAYKKGFLPALTRVWHQAIPEKVSAVEIKLAPQGKNVAAAGSPAPDIWELRSRLPADVLREIEMEEASSSENEEPATRAQALRPRIAAERVIGGEVRTLTDVTGSENSLSRTTVGLRGGLPNGWNYQLRGDYAVLSEEPTGEAASGNSAGLLLDVAPSSMDRVRVATRKNAISFGGDAPASFQTHAVSWSRGGKEGRVESVGARYIEEANLYRATSLGTTFFPLASRTWEVQGRYGRPAGENPGVSAALTYRHRESTVGPSGVGSEGAFFLAAPDADLSAAISAKLSARAEVEAGVVGRYLAGGYGVAPRAVARYDLGGGTVLFVRGLYRVAESETLNGTVLPRVASIEDSLEPASREAYGFGLERRAGEHSSLRFEVSSQRVEEIVRAFFEGDFLTDFDSVYLLEGNTMRQYQASARHHLSDSVEGTLAVRYGDIGGELTRDASASYGIRDSRGRFWSARAAVEVLPTRTGVAILVRGVRQNLATPAVIHTNDSDKLAVSVAQDLSVLGLTPFGSVCKLLFALESARKPVASDPNRNKREELNRTSRLLGGVALAF